MMKHKYFSKYIGNDVSHTARKTSINNAHKPVKSFLKITILVLFHELINIVKFLNYA